MDRFCINLDEDFHPYQDFSQIKVESFIFNGGEAHVKLPIHSEPATDEIFITSRLSNSDAIMKVLLLNDALRRVYDGNVYFFAPYMPYARQDRVCDVGEALSMSVMAGLINSAKFDRVYFLDPHSDVSVALINNAVPIPNTPLVRMAFSEINNKNLMLVSPDSGAKKKAENLMKEIPFAGLIKCDKTRDVKTGLLSSFDVYSDGLNGADCLIVDDICDGGGTFLGLAKELKDKGAGKLYLYVTHGIFSKGVDSLIRNRYGFEHVFTTDSFKTFRMMEQFDQFKIKI